MYTIRQPPDSMSILNDDIIHLIFMEDRLRFPTWVQLDRVRCLVWSKYRSHYMLRESRIFQYIRFRVMPFTNVDSHDRFLIQYYADYFSMAVYTYKRENIHHYDTCICQSNKRIPYSDMTIQHPCGVVQEEFYVY